MDRGEQKASKLRAGDRKVKLSMRVSENRPLPEQNISILQERVAKAKTGNS